MRTILSIPIALALSSCAAGAFAKQAPDAGRKARGEFVPQAAVGDTMIVIQATQKRNGVQIIGPVEMGQRFNVQAVKPAWLWPDYGKPGWIPSAHVLPADQAAEHFTRLISANPGDSRVYTARGSAWLAKERWKSAVEDLTQAIRLSGGDDFSYRERGLAWHQMGEYDKAIADFNEAIRRNPDVALYWFNRGAAWENKQEYARALADFNQAIRIDPQCAGAYNNRAFLLAACPDAKYRNAEQALRDAATACRMTAWTNFTYLGTLAAAHAESGNFAEATRWQTRALQLAPAARRADWKGRLDLYGQGKPYRETGKW